MIFGKYPEDGLKVCEKYMPEIAEGDMELINQPIDFYCQNIYQGNIIRADENGNPEYVQRAPGYNKNSMRWPITPQCLYWGPKFLYERYKLPFFISENGMPSLDFVSEDGAVHDAPRIDFLKRHLAEYERAAQDGADIAGYFEWSLLDNFEWAFGYSERFGLIYVDYVTQKRIIKDSGRWYGEFIKENTGEHK